MDLGIIGGPDGPTAVLVGGDPAGLIVLVLVIAAAAGGLVWLFRRKRKE